MGMQRAVFGSSRRSSFSGRVVAGAALSACVVGVACAPSSPSRAPTIAVTPGGGDDAPRVAGGELRFAFDGGSLHLPAVVDLHLPAFCSTVKGTRETAQQQEKDCEGGSARGCHELGVVHACGVGVTKDFERAAALEKQACERGYSDACASGGVLLLSTDPGTAQQLFRRGCDGGSNGACGNLGMLFMMEKNGEMAAPMLERSCGAKSVDACANLGILLLRGLGLPTNPTRAATLNAGACEQNSSGACNALGAQYLMGLGVARDEARGAELMAKACDAGLGDACDNLGQALLSKDPGRAKELFKKACDKGNDLACRRLGGKP
jgi:uncharacterized protein